MNLKTDAKESHLRPKIRNPKNLSTLLPFFGDFLGRRLSNRRVKVSVHHRYFAAFAPISRDPSENRLEKPQRGRRSDGRIETFHFLRVDRVRGIAALGLVIAGPSLVRLPSGQIAVSAVFCR